MAKKPVPNTVEAFDYEVTEVSPGCNDWKKGDTLTLYYNVPPAPPKRVTVDFGAPCNVVKGKLIED